MKGSRNFKVIFGWFFLACGIVLPMAMLSGGQTPAGWLLPAAAVSLILGMVLLKGARQAPDGAQTAQSPEKAPDAQPAHSAAADPQADVYRPDPAWTKVDAQVRSRQDAADLAPRCLEQAKQAAATLNAATDPDAFFRQYDYLIGRFVLLVQCAKYTRFGGEQPQVTLARLYRKSYRDKVGQAMIDRRFDKVRAEIDALDDPAARQAAAGRFDAAFDPCRAHMSEALLAHQAEKSRQLAALAAGPQPEESEAAAQS